jgi:hypothetical protein
LLYALELVLRGHVFMAGAVCALGFAWVRVRRKMLLFRPANPRKLQMTADGRLLLHADAVGEEVSLQPSSLWLGRHVLLVLRGRARTWRLLLGPDNLDAAALAALSRRLPPATFPAGSALHSVTPQQAGISPPP